MNLRQGVSVSGQDVALRAASKLEEVEVFAEADLHLGAVELERYERQCKARVQGKPEV